MISLVELPNLQDRPAIFSTFLMWLLADLFHDLPELGDPYGTTCTSSFRRPKGRRTDDAHQTSRCRDLSRAAKENLKFVST